MQLVRQENRQNRRTSSDSPGLTVGMGFALYKGEPNPTTPERPMPHLPDHVEASIFRTVQQCFCEALELDEDEVAWDAKILDDLGAESLDLLDVVFRLERSFDIQIPRGGIEADARHTTEGPGEEDGRLTAAGMRRLQATMPEVPADEITVGMKVSELPSVFRVGTFYNLVVALMEAKQVA